MGFWCFFPNCLNFMKWENIPHSTGFYTLNLCVFFILPITQNKFLPLIEVLIFQWLYGSMTSWNISSFFCFACFLLFVCLFPYWWESVNITTWGTLHNEWTSDNEWITLVFAFIKTVQAQTLLPQLVLIFNSLSITNLKTNPMVFPVWITALNPSFPQEEMLSNNFQEWENYEF